MASDRKTTQLEPGALYDISGGLTTPMRGRFIEWRQRRCQMHGERLGWEALFQRVKPSGKTSYQFAVPATARFERVT